MPNKYCKVILVILGLLPVFFSSFAFSQSISTSDKHSHIPVISSGNQAEIPVVPKPSNKTTSNTTPATTDRIGAVHSNRRSISIKSTDAGVIYPYRQASGCINCGTDPAQQIGQGIGYGVITGGIIRGIIGREIIRRDHQHPPMDFDGGRGHPMEHRHDDRLLDY